MFPTERVTPHLGTCIRLSVREKPRGVYINNSRHLARKCARIFVRGHYLFREGSRKSVSYEEQIMSKDKYPSIFSPQMTTIVFIILQIFFAARAVLKIGEYLVNKLLQAAGMLADNVRG